jgi:hypothetical protein
MLERRSVCEWCGEALVKVRADQRFCCPDCNQDFHAWERREAIAAWRKQQLEANDGYEA